MYLLVSEGGVSLYQSSDVLPYSHVGTEKYQNYYSLLNAKNLVLVPNLQQEEGSGSKTVQYPWGDRWW